jgi:hypothetical protein
MNRTFIRWRSLLRVFLAASVSFTMAGCASVYVDGAVKEVAVAQYSPPAHPAPAQVFFEFQTRGVSNVAATALLKTKVIDQVRESGLFSSVLEAAQPTAALLSITLNNVPISDDAFSKGFLTGFTFGLVGSKVSDGYVCTLKYTAPAGQPALSKSARHVIHTSLGATSAPENATKAKNMEEAATLMTRQVLSQVLNDLSNDPEFKQR